MEMRKFGVKVAIIEPAMFGGNTDIHNKQNVSHVPYAICVDAKLRYTFNVKDTLKISNVCIHVFVPSK
jgi:hypothetical protein